MEIATRKQRKVRRSIVVQKSHRARASPPHLRIFLLQQANKCLRNQADVQHPSFVGRKIAEQEANKSRGAPSYLGPSRIEELDGRHHVEVHPLRIITYQKFGELRQKVVVFGVRARLQMGTILQEGMHALRPHQRRESAQRFFACLLDFGIRIVYVKDDSRKVVLNLLEKWLHRHRMRTEAR